MTRSPVSRLLEAATLRSAGVACFGVGVVVYWALRTNAHYFAATMPMLLVGIAGLLVGYSAGLDDDDADASSAAGVERETETETEIDSEADADAESTPQAADD